MIPSILTFEFDLILGSFLTFFGPNALLLVLGLGSTHVVEKLSFSMIPSILTFEFDLDFGVIFEILGS